jgi:hypothetical protein
VEGELCLGGEGDPLVVGDDVWFPYLLPSPLDLDQGYGVALDLEHVPLHRILENKVEEHFDVQLRLLAGRARRFAGNGPAGDQLTLGYAVWDDPVGLGEDFIAAKAT